MGTGRGDDLFASKPLLDKEVGVTVGRDYMLEKPSGPSAPKLFLDTKIVPMAVNAAGSLEVALDRASARTGIRPSLILTGLVGLASIVLLGLALRPTTALARRR
jgi:hypothetical protein